MLESSLFAPLSGGFNIFLFQIHSPRLPPTREHLQPQRLELASRFEAAKYCSEHGTPKTVKHLLKRTITVNDWNNCTSNKQRMSYSLRSGICGYQEGWGHLWDGTLIQADGSGPQCKR